MTLIVSFKVDDYPFILGDLLLSSTKQVNTTPYLPSIGDARQYITNGAEYFPMGLTRKVCQFSNLAVAWSGSYMEAKQLIQHLFLQTQDKGPITFKELDTMFSLLDPEVQKALANGNLSLLGYLLDPHNDNDIGFGVNYSSPKSSLLDDLRIAGTGERTLIEYFDHQSQFEFDKLANLKPKGFESAVCTALSVVGMLLQLEIGTYENLKNYFGGGYELIAIKGKRFIRCEDIMFAFWYAQVDENGMQLTPVLKFFKQTYDSDILIIRTLELKSFDPTNPLFLTSREDEVHYFPPIYDIRPRQELQNLPKPDLNAFLLCSYILVQVGDELEVLTKFDWSKDRELPLRFINHEDRMIVQLQSKYLNDIFNSIESRR